MQQQATARVIPLNNHSPDYRERKAPSATVDTIWSGIDDHLRSIERVTAGMANSYTLTSDAVLCCETLRMMVENMRFLQDEQGRRPYRHIRDEVIAEIASKKLPEAISRIQWPRAPHIGLWLDSILLSAAHIARLARQRQAQHKEAQNDV